MNYNNMFLVFLLFGCSIGLFISIVIVSYLFYFFEILNIKQILYTLVVLCGLSVITARILFKKIKDENEVNLK